MECDQVTREELAERYLRGELDLATQDAFEIHLLECAGCARAMEALEETRVVLRDSAAEIRSSAPQPRWQPPRWVWVPVMAVLLLAAGVPLLLRFQGGKRSAETARNDAAARIPPSAAKAGGPASEATTPSGAQKPLPIRPPGTVQESAPHGGAGGTTQPSAEIAASTPSPPLAAESTEPTAERSQPAATADTAESKIATELFRLGTVYPPAYTFAGASGSPGSKGPSGLGYSAPKAGLARRAAFEDGMLAYVQGHYRDASAHLEGAVQQEPAAADANFYLGISRLMEGRPAVAVSPLKAAAAKPSALRQEAHFYLAKAYIQAGQLAEAEEELNAAIAVPGRVGGEARALLARLQALRSEMSKPRPPAK